jgi:hypothetical protein
LKTRLGGAYDPERVRHPEDLEALHMKVIDLWRRLAANRDEAMTEGDRSTIELLSLEVSFLESFANDLAALRGVAPCGECPQSRKDKTNSACPHFARRRQAMTPQEHKLTAEARHLGYVVVRPSLTPVKVA